MEALNRGEIPFFEPGLEALVKQNLAAGRLTFTTDLARAVRESYIVFIAVGTPPGDDGSADLQHVVAAAMDIGRAMDGERIVITKSTVPVGPRPLCVRRSKPRRTTRSMSARTPSSSGRGRGQ